MRKMRFLLTPKVLFLTFFFCFNGCAYYNTFYNAKDYYNQAQAMKKRAKEEKPSSAILALYDKSINKCTKVVKFYPRSQWVDDAIFLMGNCYFEKGEYEKALRKYEEILLYYPKSHFVEEVQLRMGQTYLQKGEYIEAIRIAAQLLEKNPKGKWASEAQKLKGDAYYQSQDYEKTIKEYQNFLVQHPKHRDSHLIRLRLANSLINLGNLAQAKKILEALVKGGKLPLDLYIEGTLKLGDCYETERNGPLAIELYSRLLTRELSPFQMRKVELKVAYCHKNLGNYSEAIKRFESIAVKYPRTEEGAEALLQVGLIYQETLKNLEKASEFFEKARSECPSSKISEEALRKATDIGKLKEYQDKLAAKGNEEDLAKIQFLLAEHYLFQLGEVDSALSEYTRLVKSYPSSLLAPKAEYAIAWIQENIKKNEEEAEKHYEKLIQDYPNTEYADAARKALGLPTSSPSQETTKPDSNKTLSPSLQVDYSDSSSNNRIEEEGR